MTAVARVAVGREAARAVDVEVERAMVVRAAAAMAEATAVVRGAVKVEAAKVEGSNGSSQRSQKSNPGCW